MNFNVKESQIIEYLNLKDNFTKNIVNDIEEIIKLLVFIIKTSRSSISVK